MANGEHCSSGNPSCYIKFQQSEISSDVHHTPQAIAAHRHFPTCTSRAGTEYADAHHPPSLVPAGRLLRDVGT